MQKHKRGVACTPFMQTEETNARKAKTATTEIDCLHRLLRKILIDVTDVRRVLWLCVTRWNISSDYNASPLLR